MTHPPAHRPEDGAPCRSSRIPPKRRPFAEIGPTITARFKSIGIGLYGTYPGLIITYLTFSLPFSIWMLVGYFNAIPRELEEAAMVDGATPIGALFRILIPVSLPGIVAVAIFAFITAWGEVLFASFLTTDETTTLAIGLRNYASQSNVYWNQLMAASIVVSLPVVIAFLAMQRYIVGGLTAGGVK